jgi:hypothetical protein
MKKLFKCSFFPHLDPSHKIGQNTHGSILVDNGTTYIIYHIKHLQVILL